MADGLNKDVLQSLSDDQRQVAAAAPEPVNEPEPVPATKPATDEAPSKPAGRAASRKDSTAK